MIRKKRQKAMINYNNYTIKLSYYQRKRRKMEGKREKKREKDKYC